MDKGRRDYYEQAIIEGKTQAVMAQDLGITQPTVSAQLKALRAEVEAAQESKLLARIETSRQEYDVVTETQALAQLWTGKVHEAGDRQDHRVYGRLALDAITLLAKLRRELVDRTEASVTVAAAAWTDDDEETYRALVEEAD